MAPVIGRDAQAWDGMSSSEEWGAAARVRVFVATRREQVRFHTNVDSPHQVVDAIVDGELSAEPGDTVVQMVAVSGRVATDAAFARQLRRKFV